MAEPSSLQGAWVGGNLTQLPTAPSTHLCSGVKPDESASLGPIAPRFCALLGSAGTPITDARAGTPSLATLRRTLLPGLRPGQPGNTGSGAGGADHVSAGGRTQAPGPLVRHPPSLKRNVLPAGAPGPYTHEELSLSQTPGTPPLGPRHLTSRRAISIVPHLFLPKHSRPSTSTHVLFPPGLSAASCVASRPTTLPQPTCLPFSHLRVPSLICHPLPTLCTVTASGTCQPSCPALKPRPPRGVPRPADSEHQNLGGCQVGLSSPPIDPPAYTITLTPEPQSDAEHSTFSHPLF